MKLLNRFLNYGKIFNNINNKYFVGTAVGYMYL